ncbi:MAG: hypothetical protein PHD02_03180 [Bacilli bacterium]|nr:hypothetical protein [Bacilli bacterium]
MCFLLVGCGNSTSDETQEAVDQGNSDNSDKSEIKLYSTEDRLVYNAGGVYYIVIDFDDEDNADGLKWIYNYSDSATAAAMVAGIKTNLDEESDVVSVTQDIEYGE